MGLLARLFSFFRKTENVEKNDGLETGKKPAIDEWPTGQISFDPGLIAKLKNEHVELFKVFTQIKMAADAGNLLKLPELLEALKSGLQAHLMLENVKFYTYVKQKSENDQEASDFIAQIKREMDGIARTVIRFASAYSTQTMSADQLASFKAELAQIGDVLTKRITMEETKLYILYKPLD